MPSLQLDHESLFDHVYTFASIGIVLVSLDGAYLKANPAFCKMLGYSRDEFSALHFSAITHPDDLAKQTAFNRDLTAGRLTSYEIEKRYLHKEGHYVWTSLHVALVVDEVTGEPRYFVSHMIDISEKKAAQELYTLISENAEEVIYCMDADGTCYYCSPSVRHVLGYEPNELIGSKNLDILHPEDVDMLQKMSPSDRQVLRYRNLHKDGRYLWLETTVKLIDDGSGTQKVLAVSRDITERKQNEDMLAEAHRIASLSSWEWDLIANTVSLSEEVYRIGGLEQMELHHPEDIMHLVHADEQQKFIDAFKQAVKSHDLNFEIRHVQTDGSTQYLHIRGIVSTDENGNPVKMNGTIQDVTERKQVELQLQETIQRYTSLKKYNHDAVLSLDMEGRIVHGNEVAERLTGYSISEIAGRSAAVLIGEDHLRKVLAESMNDASIENSIDKFRHKDGHLTEVLTTIAPIIINENNVGFYIIAKDITEQKKLMIEKEAAESTNQAKSEFLAMMSHEIRTPMNGVIGMTDLLSDTTVLDAEQREYVEIIRKSGYTLLAIINDILDFSKLDSGKTTLHEQSFDIREMVAEAFDILSVKANAKRLDMQFSVSPDIPNALVGDAERLKQILMNLIGNAIKFTSSGGVTVSVKPAGRQDSLAHMTLEFAVADTGIGIPPTKIGRLFEPFYQLDHFMNRTYEGTGLGLAISKRLVELMGGAIWAESSAGAGATFAFTVQLARPDQGQPPKPEKFSVPKGEAEPPPLRILVAEDNEINQLVLQRMLEKDGHSVTVAADGKEACQIAVQAPLDLILMDVQMPRMNGLEATQAIQEQLPPEKRPVIVAVTANALKGDREKCLAAGMDDYVSKPVRRETISAIVNKYFQHK